MKMQLKTFGAGLLMIVGINVLFTIPYGVLAVLYNAGMPIEVWHESIANVMCMFGRVIGMVFAGILLAKWRSRWEAFSPSKYHSTAADFVQRYLLLLICLFAAACITWRWWNLVAEQISIFLTAGTKGLLILEDGTRVIPPLELMLDDFIIAPFFQFAVIGFVAGYFGRKSKLRLKTAVKFQANAAM